MFSEQVQREFDRWSAELGDGDPYATSTTVGIKEVLRAHFIIAEFFTDEGKGLGGVGPRDQNLLHSTMHRQLAGFGQAAWTNRFEICATLFYGIIRNHPFFDANKRTALLALLFHLEKFGVCPDMSEKELEEFAVEVAERRLDRYARYKQVLKRCTENADVVFIGDFLRRSTRRIEKEQRVVTYRQLVSILARFGLTFDNPHDNHIDIVRFEEKTSFLGLRPPKLIKTRIGMIGFHGWTKQVSKSDLKRLRAMTRLDYEHGVDSAAFFGDYDAMQELMTSYQEPLRRLADR